MMELKWEISKLRRFRVRLQDFNLTIKVVHYVIKVPRCRICGCCCTSLELMATRGIFLLIAVIIIVELFLISCIVRILVVHVAIRSRHLLLLLVIWYYRNGNRLLRGSCVGRVRYERTSVRFWLVLQQCHHHRHHRFLCCCILIGIGEWLRDLWKIIELWELLFLRFKGDGNRDDVIVLARGVVAADGRWIDWSSGGVVHVNLLEAIAELQFVLVL